MSCERCYGIFPSYRSEREPPMTCAACGAPLESPDPIPVWHLPEVTNTVGGAAMNAEKLLVADVGTEPSWWWLSFVGCDGFLGVAIVRASDPATAVHNAHVLGVNPGGEVCLAPLPSEMKVPEWAREKLLNREQCAIVNGWFEASLFLEFAEDTDEPSCAALVKERKA